MPFQGSVPEDCRPTSILFGADGVNNLTTNADTKFATMSTVTAKSTRHLVERIRARVFCSGPRGGNPVTVFSSPSPLQWQTQQKLATACDWESVMVATNDQNSSASTKTEYPEMAFYMPSGEQVSFCGHAAMGGAFAVAGSSSPSECFFQTAQLQQITDNPQHGASKLYKVSLPSRNSDDESMSNVATLYMETEFTESRPSHGPGLHRLLREHLGLSSSHLTKKNVQYAPTLVNSSVARPKTLVYVNSLDVLANVKQPIARKMNDKDSPTSVPASSLRTSFSKACESIDDSTGIYLYTHRDTVSTSTSVALHSTSGSWECRQFPRSSGYPEDPATGIAAAALAASLYTQGLVLKEYSMYQGTYMDRPSLIQVVDLLLQEPYGTDDNRISGGRSADKQNEAKDDDAVPILASFGLRGRVEIDDREWIEVDDGDM